MGCAASTPAVSKPASVPCASAAAAAMRTEITPSRRSLCGQALIKTVPRDLVHILARLVPLATVNLVRADHCLWGRYNDDPYVWGEAVKAALAAKEGRQALYAALPVLLARCPSLSHLLPHKLKPAPTASLTRDGALLACVTALLKITIYETATLRVVADIVGAELIVHLAFSPAGRRLACRTHRGVDVYTARDDVWSFTAHLARHASYMLSMCFLSDDVLTVGTSRADVILWDVLALASSTIVNDLGPGPGIVLGLAASAAHLACGRLFPRRQPQGQVDVRTHAGELVFTLDGHGLAVRDVCFSLDGGLLASASDDGTVRLWNVAAQECVSVITLGSPVTSVFLARDGWLVAAQYYTHRVLVMELRAGRPASTRALAVDWPRNVFASARPCPATGLDVFVASEADGVLKLTCGGCLAASS